MIYDTLLEIIQDTMLNSYGYIFDTNDHTEEQLKQFAKVHYDLAELYFEHADHISTEDQKERMAIACTLVAKGDYLLGKTEVEDAPVQHQDGTRGQVLFTPGSFLAIINWTDGHEDSFNLIEQSDRDVLFSLIIRGARNV